MAHKFGKQHVDACDLTIGMRAQPGNLSIDQNIQVEPRENGEADIWRVLQSPDTRIMYGPIRVSGNTYCLIQGLIGGGYDRLSLQIRESAGRMIGEVK